MKIQRNFSPSTKRIFEGWVRPADLRILTRQGQGRERANPHDGRIGSGLRKFYLSTLITQLSIQSDPQFDQI